MLRNRLAVLLAQKQIKISRMALDTGLSRTTLTALSQNDSKRIDNDTLNTILMYLQITPNDFFNFLSYDFEVKITPSEFNFSYDKEIGNNEKNEYLSIEKGIFDLFIRKNPEERLSLCDTSNWTFALYLYNIKKINLCVSCIFQNITFLI